MASLPELIPIQCSFCGRTPAIGKLQHCSRCLKATYCSVKCQADDFHNHNGTCVPLNRASTVVLMMIWGSGGIEDDWDEWLPALKSKVNVRLIQTRQAALDFLTKGSRHIPVILADGGLARKQERGLQQLLARFVQTGGVVVLAFYLAHRTTQDELDSLFADFNLPWRRGDRLMDYFAPNNDSSHISAFAFDDNYKQMAQQLRNVELEDAVYLPNTETVPKMGDIEQVPAALGRCGGGWVGFIGDLDGEIKPIPILLYMCGVMESDSSAGTLCNCLTRP